MFEKSIEEFWFPKAVTSNLLAKRAATPEVEEIPYLLHPLLGEAVVARHDSSAPDVEKALLEKVHRDHLQGAPSAPGFTAFRKANLEKLLPPEDLTKLNGARTSLPVSDDLLEKRAHSRQVSAVAEWLGKQITAGVAAGISEADTLAALLEKSSDPQKIREAAQELLSLAEAA